MEHIQSLITERVLDEQIAAALLTKSGLSGTTMMSNSDNNNQQCDLAKIRKNEKLRQVRENQLIDSLFNFRQASNNERIQFEKISFQIMCVLTPKFSYTIKGKGCFIDIVELFTRYYQFTNDPARLEELLLLTQNNLFYNFSFLCLLLKWLVEKSRTQLIQMLKSCKLIKGFVVEQQNPQWIPNTLLNSLTTSTTNQDQKNKVNLNARDNHFLIKYLQTEIPAQSETAIQHFPKQQQKKNLVNEESNTNNFAKQQLATQCNPEADRSNGRKAHIHCSLKAGTPETVNSSHPICQPLNLYNAKYFIEKHLECYDKSQKKLATIITQTYSSNPVQLSQAGHPHNNQYQPQFQHHHYQQQSKNGKSAVAGAVTMPTQKHLSYFKLVKEVLEDADFEMCRKSEYFIQIHMKSLTLRNCQIQKNIEDFRNEIVTRYQQVSLQLDNKIACMQSNQPQQNTSDNTMDNTLANPLENIDEQSIEGTVRQPSPKIEGKREIVQLDISNYQLETAVTVSPEKLSPDHATSFLENKELSHQYSPIKIASQERTHVSHNNSVNKQSSATTSSTTTTAFNTATNMLSSSSSKKLHKSGSNKFNSAQDIQALENYCLDYGTMGGQDTQCQIKSEQQIQSKNLVSCSSQFDKVNLSDVNYQYQPQQQSEDLYLLQQSNKIKTFNIVENSLGNNNSGNIHSQKEISLPKSNKSGSQKDLQQQEIHFSNVRHSQKQQQMRLVQCYYNEIQNNSFSTGAAIMASNQNQQASQISRKDSFFVNLAPIQVKLKEIDQQNQQQQKQQHTQKINGNNSCSEQKVLEIKQQLQEGMVNQQTFCNTNNKLNQMSKEYQMRGSQGQQFHNLAQTSFQMHQVLPKAIDPPPLRMPAGFAKQLAKSLWESNGQATTHIINGQLKENSLGTENLCKAGTQDQQQQQNQQENIIKEDAFKQRNQSQPNTQNSFNNLIKSSNSRYAKVPYLQRESSEKTSQNVAASEGVQPVFKESVNRKILNSLSQNNSKNNSIWEPQQQPIPLLNQNKTNLSNTEQQQIDNIPNQIKGKTNSVQMPYANNIPRLINYKNYKQKKGPTILGTQKNNSITTYNNNNLDELFGHEDSEFSDNLMRIDSSQFKLIQSPHPPPNNLLNQSTNTQLVSNINHIQSQKVATDQLQEMNTQIQKIIKNRQDYYCEQLNLIKRRKSYQQHLKQKELKQIQKQSSNITENQQKALPQLNINENYYNPLSVLKQQHIYLEPMINAI